MRSRSDTIPQRGPASRLSPSTTAVSLIAGGGELVQLAPVTRERDHGKVVLGTALQLVEPTQDPGARRLLEGGGLGEGVGRRIRAAHV